MMDRRLTFTAMRKRKTTVAAVRVPTVPHSRIPSTDSLRPPGRVIEDAEDEGQEGGHLVGPEGRDGQPQEGEEVVQAVDDQGEP